MIEVCDNDCRIRVALVVERHTCTSQGRLESNYKGLLAVLLFLECLHFCFGSRECLLRLKVIVIM